MVQTIAKLRIEANPNGDLLWIDFMHDDGQVYNSQALPATTTAEQAQETVDAINDPAAWLATIEDIFRPERVKRTIRLQ